MLKIRSCNPNFQVFDGIAGPQSPNQDNVSPLDLMTAMSAVDARRILGAMRSFPQLPASCLGLDGWAACDKGGAEHGG